MDFKKLTKNMVSVLPVEQVNKIINANTALWETVKDNYCDKQGHGPEHILDVYSNVINNLEYISKNLYSLDCERYDIYTISKILTSAALVHDMFSDTNRDEHNELACQWIYDVIKDKTLHPWSCHYNDTELYLLSNVVREHRASYTEPYTNSLGEIFNAMDLGHIDLVSVIDRCYNFANNTKFKGISCSITENYLKDVCGLNDVDIAVIYHLQDKYSEKHGYAFNKENSTGIYNRIYLKELTVFWEKLEKLFKNPKLLFMYKENVR